MPARAYNKIIRSPYKPRNLTKPKEYKDYLREAGLHPKRVTITQDEVWATKIKVSPITTCSCGTRYIKQALGECPKCLKRGI